jgi:YegS/Rv2252/BmrU family lipid kinase
MMPITAAVQPATLIYNPHAGFDDWQESIAACAAYWEENGWQITIRETEHPGHATELAADAVAAGHPLVIAAGGDGTLHEVANGLLGTDTILAPLPAGTTNCLTRDLGLPGPSKATPNWLITTTQRLLDGAVHGMDVGQCSNGKSFLLWAGMGLDSYVVETVEPRSRLLKRFGLAGYVAKAAVPFVFYQGVDMRITVDADVVEGPVLTAMICNSRTYAGGLFTLNPRGVLDDGQMEVWIFRGRFAPEMLVNGAWIVAQRHHDQRHIIQLTGSHVTVEASTPQTFHLDGELNRATPFTCMLLPRALRLLVPAGAPADLFVHAGEPLCARVR